MACALGAASEDDDIGRTLARRRRSDKPRRLPQEVHRERCPDLAWVAVETREDAFKAELGAQPGGAGRIVEDELSCPWVLAQEIISRHNVLLVG